MSSEQQHLKHFFDITVGKKTAESNEVHIEKATTWITAGSLSTIEAFDVYRTGYIARLTEALGETYETIWKFLGDDGFFAVAKSFIEQTPSTDPNLSNYGRQFPQFLTSQTTLMDYGYIRDLAFLDWTRSWLFHQKTENGLTPESLAQNLTQKSVVQFVSSFVWMKSLFPLFSLWKAIHQELDPPDFSKNENVVLFKKDDQVYLLPASNGTLQILENLRYGQCLEQAVEDGNEEDILYVIEFLKTNHLIYELKNS